jgi:hypothetical protein
MYTGLFQFGVRRLYKPVLPSLHPVLLLVSAPPRNSRGQIRFERLVVVQLVKIIPALGKSPNVHYHFNKCLASHDFKQKHPIIAF